MNHKFQRGKIVFVRIGSRPPLEMVVIECLEGLMYRLDWSRSGFDSLLNTVRVPEKSISGSP